MFIFTTTVTNLSNALRAFIDAKTLREQSANTACKRRQKTLLVLPGRAAVAPESSQKLSTRKVLKTPSGFARSFCRSAGMLVETTSWSLLTKSLPACQLSPPTPRAMKRMPALSLP